MSMGFSRCEGAGEGADWWVGFMFEGREASVVADMVASSFHAGAVFGACEDARNVLHRCLWFEKKGWLLGVLGLYFSGIFFGKVQLLGLNARRAIWAC